MGSHITPSFCVENPEARLQQARTLFTVDDFLYLMDNEAPDNHGVISLRTRRRLPARRNRWSAATDDVTVWGPYVDAVLSPGEYACILAASNTSDGGSGSIYYKRKSDEAVEIIDTVVDQRKEAGGDAARECLYKYEFKPTVYPSRVLGLAYLDHDPHILFSGIRTLELALPDPETNLTLEDGCPVCAGEEPQQDWPSLRFEHGPISSGKTRRFYLTQRECDVCSSVYIDIDWAKLPNPKNKCDCGGDFCRYEYQYADIGSTAFECEQCGIITFDIGQLSVSMFNPAVPYDERDTVHPDYTGYYDGDGKRSVWPPELA